MPLSFWERDLGFEMETAHWEYEGRWESAFRESLILMPRTMRSVILGHAKIFFQRLDMQKWVNIRI